MTLNETRDLMVSHDYKERFKAEYHQLKNRTEGLERMLDGMKNKTLSFTPRCSKELLESQLKSMKAYKDTLEKRADVEEIEL